MKKSLLGAAVALAFIGASAPALSATLVVNLAGFKAVGDFDDPANSFAFFTLPAGSVINDYSYNVTFTSYGVSYLSEFVLSVNNPDSTLYMDVVPSLTDGPGTETVSGTFLGADAAGLLYGGAPFTLGAGPNNLLIYVYDLFPDGASPADAVVGSGSLTINFTAPVPEPATYGLMGLGLLGVAAFARRRKAAEGLRDKR